MRRMDSDGDGEEVTSCVTSLIFIRTLTPYVMLRHVMSLIFFHFMSLHVMSCDRQADRARVQGGSKKTPLQRREEMDTEDD